MIIVRSVVSLRHESGATLSRRDISSRVALASYSTHPSIHTPQVLKDAFSGSQAVGSAHLPYTVRTDNAPKVRFSATLGEEPEVEVVLV